MILLRLFGYAVGALVGAGFLLGWVSCLAFGRFVEWVDGVTPERSRRRVNRPGQESNPADTDGVSAVLPSARGDVTPAAFSAMRCASDELAPPAHNGPEGIVPPDRSRAGCGGGASPAPPGSTFSPGSPHNPRAAAPVMFDLATGPHLEDWRDYWKAPS